MTDSTGSQKAEKVQRGGRKFLADTMTTVEMAEHRRRNGIFLLPVGCCEMHGLHVGLSVDTFVAEATCRVLAHEWDALVMPPIHYTYAGATSPWPGTASVLPGEILNYVVAVVKGILRNGFKKLILVSHHGPNQEVLTMALRTVFEQTGEIPIFFKSNQSEFLRRVKEEWPNPHSESAAYLMSLYICGRHGEFDPTIKSGDVGRTFPYESFRRLAEHGVSMPYYFQRPEDHVGTYPGLSLDDAPRLAQIYREVLHEQARGLPEHYEEFQEYMRKMIESAPWENL